MLTVSQGVIAKARTSFDLRFSFYREGREERQVSKGFLCVLRS